MSSLPKIERAGAITILTFAQVVRDVENVIARDFQGLTTGTGGSQLLLNFCNVEYLTSVELGTLIALNKYTRSAGGQLILFNLTPLVREVFTVTRLDTLLTICGEDLGC